MEHLGKRSIGTLLLAVGMLSSATVRCQTLIDVAFGQGTNTTKTGPAAIGQSGSDFWNFYTRDDGHGGWLTFGFLTNLKTVAGVATGAGLTVANAPGQWGDGSSDLMFASYIYPFSGNATVSITNLPAGNYDFYIYGPDGTYQLTSAGADYGTRVTTNAPVVNPVVWQEGVQYVIVRTVAVAAGQAVTIAVGPGVSGYATISGLQITSSAGTPGNVPPTITSQPASKSATIGSNVTFTVLSSGTAPFSYQWFFNDSPIGGNDYNLNLSNVQTNDSGNYKVIVANSYGSATSAVAVLTVSQLAPLITSQPQDQTVSIGSNALFSVTASGAPTLHYQWSFNGTNLAGATRSSFAINNVQPRNAGNYAVRVSNNYGAATSSNAALTVVGIPPSITSQPASMTVPSGTNVILSVTASGSAPLSYQWNFNGSPVSGATQSALTLNNIQTNQAGTYFVQVTNFMGSTNSANAILDVVKVNHQPVANSQNLVIPYNGSASLILSGSDSDGDSLSFTVTTAPSHGTLSGTAPNLTYQAASGYSGSDHFDFTVNDGQTDSVPASVSITILPSGTLPLIDVDFGAGTSTTEIGPAAIGHSSTDFWNFYTRDDGQGGYLTFGALSNLKTVEGVTTSAGLTVANAPGAWGDNSSDTMFNSYLYPFGGNATINITNLPAGSYDLYVYGPDGTYNVKVGATDYGTRVTTNAPIVNPVVWREGVQYVIVPNLPVAGGQTITLIVMPGVSGYATISGLQIVSVTGVNHAPVANSQTIFVAQDSTNTITLTGSDLDGDSLFYNLASFPAHGSLSGTPPNLTYMPTGGYSGSDSFGFKVNDGHTDSALATVNITVLQAGAKPIIDVDFTAGSGPSPKSGFAATGRTPSDFWNFYTRDGQGGWLSFSGLANLKTVEGFSTLAGLTVANAPGQWGNGSADPMYNTFIYPFDGGNITLTVTNLDTGAYDFYLYGLDSSYELRVGGLNYGTKPLPNGPIANPVVWQENLQYALFKTVQVTNGSPVTIIVHPGPGGYATLCGMQVAQVDAPPAVAPAITQQPSSQSVSEGSDVTFSVAVSGTSPFSYQWRYEGADITDATTSSLTLHQVTLTNGGHYSVRVVNVLSNALSDSALLTVTAVNHPPVANAQSVVAPQNGSKAIVLTGSDPDGSPVTFSILNGPSHGTLTGTPPNVNYQPVANYSGSDNFTFKVNDGQLNSASATISILVLSDSSKGLIDVDFGAGSSSEVGPAAIGQGANDFWNFYTRDDGYGNWLSFGTLSNLKLADQTVTGAGLTVANAPGAWGNNSADAMYNSYIYPFDGGNITVTVTNLPSGQYDFYVYGLESSYSLAVGGSDYGTKSVPNGPISNPVVWQENLQFVVFRNVAIPSSGVPAVLTVRPGPGGYATISGMQIASITGMNHAPVANAATMTVNQNSTNAITLTGSDLDGDPMTFTVIHLPDHGVLSGTPPNVIYVPFTGYSGPDRVGFQVNDSQADSTEANVSINVVVPGSVKLIDVAMGAGTSTSKTGFAATGQNTTDFWNFYTRDDGHGGWLTFGSVTNLKFVDGTSSGAGMTVANAPGAWGDSSTDPMFSSYIYPFSGNATVNLTNLAAGSYDIYIYGPDGTYQLNVGATDYGTKITTNAPIVNPIVWQEAVQYVVMRSVAVAPGQTVTITVRPGVAGYAMISGLQISPNAAANSGTNVAPVARASVLRTFPVSLLETNLLVVSGNNSNSPVILDGSLSSDANHDSLSYNWFENSLTAFATQSGTTNTWSVGTHDVTLVVNDGKANGIATIEFEVITISDAMIILALEVEQSDLDRTTKRQLETVLTDNSGNTDLQNLQAFQSKVQSYVQPVNAALAAALVGAAQYVIDSIGEP